jgi:Transposase, Mutator family
VSSGTVSRLNQKIYRHIDAWRNRAIEGEYPYLFLDVNAGRVFPRIVEVNFPSFASGDRPVWIRSAPFGVGREVA